MCVNLGGLKLLYILTRQTTYMLVVCSVRSNMSVAAIQQDTYIRAFLKTQE